MKHALATADFTFPLLSHDKALDLIKALDFAGVDLGLFEQRSHLWPSREFQDPERSGDMLRKKLDDRGLACADVFVQLDPNFQTYAVNHPDKSRRAHASDSYKRALDYAQALGSRHMTLLPGVKYSENESATESWMRAVDELLWRADYASARGIVLGVEAHVGSILETPEEAIRMMRAVDRLSLTLDYTHFIRGGMSQSRIDPLCQYASHLHVRGAREGRLQVSYQNNVIDYRQVVSHLEKADYQGWMGIEYVWIDWESCNECDNLSETILFRDALRAALFGASPAPSRVL